MNSFVFNGFKERFLNGEVPSSFNAVFLPMNNKFINNFSKDGFSIEQFRTTDDLEKFCDKEKDSNLLEDSKLKYVGICNTWHAITETEEQTKPMYVNIENRDAFTASEYWADCSANKYINSYIKNGFYILRTKEEFNWFANEVNDGNNGITGVLFDDISYKVSFTIGNDETVPFQGILDGNGHSLKNAFYVCTGSDNGLVSVLGAKGIVRNFVLSNDKYKRGTSPTLKGRKQINLNYLKNDARDINAGLLVGRNYGTIENIKLSGNDENRFTFSFSGFVPQVYSVTNKSDDVSDFTSIRKKFDNGENFYFLNSWCINSPGNICPYVGYFAEGIFAQKAIGYNVAGTPSKACIDYAPKMKSYYDTGSEEEQITIDDESSTDLYLLAVFMKYDWCNDYLFTHGHDANSLEYIQTYTYTDPDDKKQKEIKYYTYYDNLNYRSYSVKVSDKVYNGMTNEELKVLRSDPEWYSFNDDPAGRNAVAIVLCEHDGKKYFLELNGMYTADDAGTKTQTNRFTAGALDFLQLGSPVIENEPSADEKKFYTEIPSKYTTNGKTYWVSKGYLIKENKIYKIKNDDNKTDGYDKNIIKVDWEGSSGVDIPTDVSNSIRAFDENGNQIKINSCDGFSLSWYGQRTQEGSVGHYADNANSKILTNVVFRTDIDINLDNAIVNGPLNGCKIRFASKLLFPYKTINNTNLTHYSNFNIEEFKNIFKWPDPTAPSTHLDFYYNMYSSDYNLFPKARARGDNKQQFMHVNDYKQFIASNFASFTKNNGNGSYTCQGIGKLFQMFSTFPKSTESGYTEYLDYFKHIFEKVDKDGVHHMLTDNDLARTDIRKALHDELSNNISKYLKHEVDYTNVSYASQDGDIIPQGGDYNDGRVSRHFLFSNLIGSADIATYLRPLLMKYLKTRKYQYLMQENSSDNAFYKKPINFENDTIEKFSELSFDKTAGVAGVNFDFTKRTGVLSLETFDYNKFQYAPFISRSVVNGSGNVKENDFEAGAVYDQLITDPNGKIHKDWIYRAANLYAKNPLYYGLDYNGHWTTMAVRTSAVAEDKINQVNYNWNIMRGMYEGVPNDPDKPDGRLLWDGIYYDDLVFPDNVNGGWNYYKWDDLFNFTRYDDQYSDASMIPNCMLNKPIRMHHMVRAAYNIAPIVGANYGTVSAIFGNISVYNPNSNFVGFIGSIAGKNVNGTITEVNLNVKYELNDNNKYYVKYKNTPILPYTVTKNMNIPLNPENVDYEYYSVTPNNVFVEESDKNNYKDLLSAVNCLTFYDKRNYKNNPNYIEDKRYYDDVKYFSYFTSAWYDDGDEKNKVTDDVLSYQLKPVFVIGGLVGKAVASRAYDNENDIKKTKINKVNINVTNNTVFNKENVDIHSNCGSVIGQIDIQTTDTDYNKNDKLIELENVNVTAKIPTFGYVEYQPIDINTVVALSNRPRNKKNDYSGPYQNVLFAIDIPFNFDTGGKDKKYDYDKYEYANINQSSGAFIKSNTDAANVFNDLVSGKEVYDSNKKYEYDLIDYQNGIFGLQSTNSVLGSNTLFVPGVYPFEDTTKPLYNYWKSIGGNSISIQEKLYDTNTTNHRFYLRNVCSSEYHFSNRQAEAPVITINSDNTVFSNKTLEDKYFSYTYTTGLIDDERDTRFGTLSAEMFNNISVKFCSNEDKENGIINNYYVADFSAQDEREGDGIDYSGRNYLVFGQSLSPVEIRKQINNSTTFTSTLFSAYQYVLDDNGNPIYENNIHKKMEATNDYQLGGFLVIEKPAGDTTTSTAGNLMMFVNNDNGAEIDGRSYNLAFPKNTYTVTAHSNKGTIYEADGSPRTYVTASGGVLINVKGRS